ncbi:MAG: ROK family protein [Planctomycetota bacterium]
MSKGPKPPEVDAPVVGIDLGGTNMQIGVVHPDIIAERDEPKLMGRSKRKTKSETGAEAVLDRIAEAVREACDDAAIQPKDLAALGIGAPGGVDPEKGIVHEAVNLRWNDLPLAHELSTRLDGVRVVVDNDVNVAVWGENRVGAGEHSQQMLGVWVGTGIGGGLVIHGDLYYGHFRTAGEIGHMLLFPQQQPGSRSLEHNCSRTAIADRLGRLMRANRKSVIHDMVEGDYERIKSKVIARAWEQGDELTHEVLDSAIDLLGAHIGGVVTLLGLERVVLGGGLTEALGPTFVGRVTDAIRTVAFPDVCRGVQVAASSLLDDAGIYGAAMLAAARVEKP